MAGVSTEVKVGFFVMAGIVLLAYMTFRLGSFQFGEPEGYTVWCVFDNATGLKPGAPVEMAGIRIGKVKSIGLYHSKARVTFFIRSEAPLAVDARAVIRTRGVLGDKFVAMEPGSPGAPRLKHGARLARAKAPPDLDEVMNRIGRIADDVKDLTSSLKVSLGSPQSQQNIQESLANIRELTAVLKEAAVGNRGQLNRVIENLDHFTSDLSQISGDNRQALNETIRNFHVISSQLERTIGALASVVEKVDQGQGTLGALVNNRQTVDDLNASLASLKDIARKIDEGKGSIGKLVNDDSTVTKIDEALTGINNYLGQADRWRVYVDYRGEYLFGESSLRSYVNLRLQPKADKFYLVGVMWDPRGRRTEKKSISTVTHPDGSVTTTTDHWVQYDKDAILFNAQIGKRFHDVTFRGGVFASTGGAAVDYHMLNDALRLTLEAYDFRADYDPHLKFAVDYSFWKYFYLTAGVDDFINDDQSSFFLGAGFNFYDDDLKYLLTAAPKP